VCVLSREWGGISINWFEKRLEDGDNDKKKNKCNPEGGGADGEARPAQLEKKRAELEGEANT